MMMALMSVAPMDTCMSYGVTMVRRTKTDGWMAGAKQCRGKSSSRNTHVRLRIIFPLAFFLLSHDHRSRPPPSFCPDGQL